MPYNTEKLLRDRGDNPIPQYFDTAIDKFSPLVKMEYYGATINERPLPTQVPVGAFYMAVDTAEIWQSNGTEWVVR